VLRAEHCVCKLGDNVHCCNAHFVVSAVQKCCCGRHLQHSSTSGWWCKNYVPACGLSSWQLHATVASVAVA
jgi:hypothetical protein